MVLLSLYGSGSRPARAGELASTLEVKVERDAVRLALRVSNETGAPVTLRFPTAQRHDFAVSRPGGEELWRWSADRLFAQAVGAERLGPGETLEYAAVWDPGGRTGRFEAVGELTAEAPRIERRVAFSVEADTAS